MRFEPGAEEVEVLADRASRSGAGAWRVELRIFEDRSLPTCWTVSEGRQAWFVVPATANGWRNRRRIPAMVRSVQRSRLRELTGAARVAALYSVGVEPGLFDDAAAAELRSVASKSVEALDRSVEASLDALGEAAG